MATLTSELDTLIAAWVARLLEQLRAQHRSQRLRENAINARIHPPAIDTGNIIAVGILQTVLKAVGERIDPHVEPLVDAIGTLDRDGDEDIAAALAFAGPAVGRAAPKLLEALRIRGIWCWPSRLARALANASRFNAAVLAALSDMLSSADESARIAAMHVLGVIGPGARSAAAQLLAFRTGSDAERCGMIDALGRQGTPTPQFLDVLEEALADENGYVGRAAASALGSLTPEPARFVPLLILACDRSEPLHDESLAESAVAALGNYGAQAGMH